MQGGREMMECIQEKDPSPRLVVERFSTSHIILYAERERETQNSETKNDWVVSEYVADHLLTSAKGTLPVSLSLFPIPISYGPAPAIIYT